MWVSLQISVLSSETTMSLLDHAYFPRQGYATRVCVLPDGGEAIFDDCTKAIHVLNPVSVTVWRLANGTRSVDQIAETSGLTPAQVRVALRSLAVAELMLSSDIIAAAFRDTPDKGEAEQMVQSYAHGSAWISGYSHALAELSSTTHESPLQGPLTLL
jgi:hypothetical protein